MAQLAPTLPPPTTVTLLRIEVRFSILGIFVVVCWSVRHVVRLAGGQLLNFLQLSTDF
jgi:hypothetical protein